MNYLLAIDDVIAHRILDTWLEVYDVVNLDTAHCARSSRHDFLQLAYQEGTVYDYSSFQDSCHSHAFLNWSDKRGLQISSLNIKKFLNYKYQLRASLLSRNITRLNCTEKFEAMEIAKVTKDIARYLASNSAIKTYPAEREKGATFTKRHRLRELVLAHCAIDVPTLELLLPFCVGLTKLTLCWCSSITPSFLSTIGSHCPHLEYLGLSALVPNNASLLEIVRQCPHLRSLDLTGCRGVSNACVPILAEHCPLLESAQLTCTGVSGVGYLALAQRLQLTSLHLPTTYDLDEARLLEILHCCPALRVLCLPDRNEAGEVVLTALAQCCPDLRELAIKLPTLPPPGTAAAAAAAVEEEVDAGICALARGCTRLEALCLRDGAHVGDTGLVCLAQHCPLLRVLRFCYLSFTTATDRSLYALARHSTRLVTLSLGRCHLFTCAGLAAVVTSCRRLRTIDFDFAPRRMRTFSAESRTLLVEAFRAAAPRRLKEWSVASVVCSEEPACCLS